MRPEFAARFPRGAPDTNPSGEKVTIVMRIPKELREKLADIAFIDGIVFDTEDHLPDLLTEGVLRVIDDREADSEYAAKLEQIDGLRIDAMRRELGED